MVYVSVNLRAQPLEPVGTGWNRLEPVGTGWNRLEPVGTRAFACTSGVYSASGKSSPGELMNARVVWRQLFSARWSRVLRLFRRPSRPGRFSAVRWSTPRRALTDVVRGFAALSTPALKRSARA